MFIIIHERMIHDLMLSFSAGSAVLQGGIFGLAGLFPGQYTQSVMGGMVRTHIEIHASLHFYINKFTKK